MDVIAQVYAKFNMINEHDYVDRTFQLIKDKFIGQQLKERPDTTPFICNLVLVNITPYSGCSTNNSYIVAMTLKRYGSRLFTF